MMFSSAMYTIDAAIAASTNGGNHAPDGARPKAAPTSVNEWATVNVVTIARICRQSRNGNDEAQQEQEVVDAGQDVRDAEADESRRGAVPRRIECHGSRQARDHHRATGLAWRQVAHGELEVVAELARGSRANGEHRAGRADAIREVRVDESLVHVKRESCAGLPKRAPWRLS